MGYGVLPEQSADARPKSVAGLLGEFPDLARDLDVAASLRLTGDAFYRLSREEQILQRARYEAEQVKHSCGHPYEVCGDSEKVWYPQRQICYVEMETAAAEARYNHAHEDKPYHDGTFEKWAAEWSLAFPYHARDGVKIFVAETDLRPDDKFLPSASSPDSPMGGG